MQVIYVSNDNLLTVDELTDEATGAYINNATVTVTIKTQAGVEVTGQTWPTTMLYVAASSGKYRCVLEDGLALTAGRNYTASITVDAGSDKVGYWEVPMKAMTRTE